MKGFDIMFSFVELKDWNQLDKYFYLNEYRVFKTPNNLYFMITKDKADKYGNTVQIGNRNNYISVPPHSTTVKPLRSGFSGKLCSLI